MSCLGADVLYYISQQLNQQSRVYAIKSMVKFLQ